MAVNLSGRTPRSLRERIRAPAFVRRAPFQWRWPESRRGRHRTRRGESDRRACGTVQFDIDAGGEAIGLAAVPMARIPARRSRATHPRSPSRSSARPSWGVLSIPRWCLPALPGEADRALEVFLFLAQARARATPMLGRTLMQPAPLVTAGGRSAAGHSRSPGTAAPGACGRALAIQFGGAASDLRALGSKGPRCAIGCSASSGLADSPTGMHRSGWLDPGPHRPSRRDDRQDHARGLRLARVGDAESRRAKAWASSTRPSAIPRCARTRLRPPPHAEAAQQ